MFHGFFLLLYDLNRFLPWHYDLKIVVCCIFPQKNHTIKHKYFFPLTIYTMSSLYIWKMLSHGWSPTWSFQGEKSCWHHSWWYDCTMETFGFSKFSCFRPIIFNSILDSILDVKHPCQNCRPEKSQKKIKKNSQKTIFDSALNRRWYYLCVCNFLSSYFFWEKKIQLCCKLRWISLIWTYPTY